MKFIGTYAKLEEALRAAEYEDAVIGLLHGASRLAKLGNQNDAERVIDLYLGECEGLIGETTPAIEAVSRRLLIKTFLPDRVWVSRANRVMDFLCKGPTQDLLTAPYPELVARFINNQLFHQSNNPHVTRAAVKWGQYFPIKR